MTAQNPKKSTQSAPVFQLKENLNGRINNLALSPSYENTLIPLFEAISNAIHSIQEKYSDLWASKGKVTVQIIKDNDGYPTGFIIEDNGVGLNTVNFESFCTYDSSHKLTKGGKGVGRLTWLKVFDKIHIKSIFSEDNESQERSFDFALDNECPFPNYKLTPLPKTSSRTVVLLSGFKGRYKATCIKNTKNILTKFQVRVN